MTLSKQHTTPTVANELFHQSCLSFYIEAAVQIMKRFPFRDSTFQHLEALDPATLKSKTVTSLAPLMSAFPTLVSDEAVQPIDTEWRMLRNTDLGTQPDITPVQF